MTATLTPTPAAEPKAALSALARKFRAARRAAVPLVVVKTPDPALAAETLCSVLTEDDPVFWWDIAYGITGRNEAGKRLLTSVAGDKPQMQTNPSSVLIDAARKLPAGGVLFFANAHRYLEGAGSASVVQAVWNLRDQYKQNRRQLILLCPDTRLPAELAQDCLVLDDPLPTAADREAILQRVYASAQVKNELPELAGEALRRAVDLTAGLAAFPLEQAAALSLKRSGLDVDDLGERNRRLIEEEPGLSIWREGQTFSDVAGYQNCKTFMSRKLSGRKPPKALIFIDELEKHLGTRGSGQTSDVKSAMHGTFLTWTQDHNVSGNLFLGPPGSGKSAMAKAVGNEGGVPTITLDFSAMQDSLVGNSEKNLRRALKVIEAVSEGNIHCIATCNGIDALSPELRRRFKDGTFFFDLPNADERRAIWDIYLNRYELYERDGTALRLPPDEGWTGAEIEVCAYRAWEMGFTLEEAAAFVVPVATSARREIDALRDQASGCFISASYPGPYRLYADPLSAHTDERDISLRDISLEE